MFKYFIGIVAVIAFFIWLPFQTWKVETSKGEHTGYVTAVETNGIFLKTNRAYIKTDTQSSQEDAYCVMDEGVYKQLQEYAARKAHVNVYFADWLKRGIQNCSGESAFIYKVEEIK